MTLVVLAVVTVAVDIAELVVALRAFALTITTVMTACTPLLEWRNEPVECAGGCGRLPRSKDSEDVTKWSGAVVQKARHRTPTGSALLSPPTPSTPTGRADVTRAVEA